MKTLQRIFVLLLCSVVWCSVSAKSAVLRNDKVEVEVDEKGNLVVLKNLTTGHNYASGGLLWRLYYDTREEQEIEVVGSEQAPKIKSNGKSIVISYDKLSVRGEVVDITLQLTLTLEGENVRFASAVKNGVDHSVVRELHYPLVHNAQLPADHDLILSQNGGRFLGKPVEAIIARSNHESRTHAPYLSAALCHEPQYGERILLLFSHFSPTKH